MNPIDIIFIFNYVQNTKILRKLRPPPNCTFQKPCLWWIICKSIKKPVRSKAVDRILVWTLTSSPPKLSAWSTPRTAAVSINMILLISCANTIWSVISRTLLRSSKNTPMMVLSLMMNSVSSACQPPTTAFEQSLSAGPKVLTSDQMNRFPTQQKAS